MKEEWTPLAVAFFDDPKVRAAGRDAAFLYIAGLCYCQERLTDGFIPEGQVPVLAVQSWAKPAAARKLVEAGMWDETDGGFQVARWSEWNKPAEVIERMREDRSKAGGKGGHQTWHVMRGIVAADCRYCQADPGHGKRHSNRHSGSHGKRVANEYPTSTSTSTTVKTPPLIPAESTPQPDRFDEFWEMYPKKEGKQDAKKAWAKAVKTTDAEVIIEGLRKHLPAMHAKAASDGHRKYLKNAQGWINGRRWEDEVEPVAVVTPPLGAVAESPATGEPMRFENGRWWIIRHNQRVQAETLPESWRVA